MPEGPLWLIMGPSGAGKTTVVAELLRQTPGLQELITTSTRPMRAHERQGQPYYFVTPAEFAVLAHTHSFLQVVEFADQRYGITHLEATRKLKQGPAVAIVIPASIPQFKAQLTCPVHTLYLDVSLAEAEARMRAEGRRPHEIANRQLADAEIARSKNRADFLIANRDLATTVRAVQHCMAQVMTA